MEQRARTSRTVRFGIFEFDLRAGELRKQGRRIRLEGQPVQVLAKLLEQPGELVTREELRKDLWSADTFVNFEQSLNAAVKRLRHALGDAPGNPRFVETLARRGYRFIAPVSAGHSVAAFSPFPRPEVESLAVLPFGNADGDPETEYLADGITESIINHVSQLAGVRVMARSTVFRYKDKANDPRAVGRRLNVDAVLLGRIQQRGDALLVGAELVDVQNGWQLWGEQYNRRLSDIFTVEEEISREISDNLRLRLTGDDRSRLTKRYTQSTEAYQDYLKGRFHWNRLTEDAVRKGMEYFEQAIQKDPQYALAYTGLSDSYGLLSFLGIAPAAALMPKAKEAALRAIEIDDTVAEAHAALAGVYKVWDWDWSGAEREYRKALALNPNYATGHRMYASYLAAVDRPEEAMQEIQRARELDPLSLPISTEAAWNCYIARDYERAAEEALRTLELEPQFAAAHGALGLAHAKRGRYDEAVKSMEMARAGSRAHPANEAALAHVLGSAGRMDEARAILEQLIQLSREQYVSPYWLALAYGGLGEKMAVLDALERAYEQHDVWMVWLGTDPRLDGVRSEPRFSELVSRMGWAPRAGSVRVGA